MHSSTFCWILHSLTQTPGLQWSSCLSASVFRVATPTDACMLSSWDSMSPCSLSHSLSWRAGLPILIFLIRQKLLFCFALGCQDLCVSASTCMHVFIRLDINRVLFRYSDFPSRVIVLIAGAKEPTFSSLLSVFLFVRQSLSCLGDTHGVTVSTEQGSLSHNSKATLKVYAKKVSIYQLGGSQSDGALSCTELQRPGASSGELQQPTGAPQEGCE